MHAPITRNPRNQWRPQRLGAWLLAGALVVGCGGTTGGAGESPEPRVRVTGIEGEHDFHYVEPESKRYVWFDVENPSSAALKINRVFSECECLKVVTSPESIPAGGSVAVRIEYASSEKCIRYTGRVILFTDDAKRAKIALRISATVGLPLEATPPVVDAGTLAAGAERTTEVTIANHGKATVKITHATPTSPACSAAVPQVAIPAGGKLRVPVRIQAGAHPGNKGARIRLHTDHAEQQTVEVRVKYTVAAPTDTQGAT